MEDVFEYRWYKESFGVIHTFLTEDEAPKGYFKLEETKRVRSKFK